MENDHESHGPIVTAALRANATKLAMLDGERAILAVLDCAQCIQDFQDWAPESPREPVCRLIDILYESTELRGLQAETLEAIGSHANDCTQCSHMSGHLDHVRFNPRTYPGFQ